MHARPSDGAVRFGITTDTIHTRHAGHRRGRQVDPVLAQSINDEHMLPMYGLKKKLPTYNVALDAESEAIWLAVLCGLPVLNREVGSGRNIPSDVAVNHDKAYKGVRIKPRPSPKHGLPRMSRAENMRRISRMYRGASCTERQRAAVRATGKRPKTDHQRAATSKVGKVHGVFNMTENNRRVYFQLVACSQGVGVPKRRQSEEHNRKAAEARLMGDPIRRLMKEAPHQGVGCRGHGKQNRPSRGRAYQLKILRENSKKIAARKRKR